MCELTVDVIGEALSSLVLGESEGYTWIFDWWGRVLKSLLSELRGS